jgi:spermidine/putrescine transport system permease protein
MAVFVVFPLGLLFYYAFFVQGFSLERFGNYFSSADEMATLFRSIGFAFTAALFCILIGYPAALILARSRSKFVPFILLLLTAPMWVNGLLRTIALGELFASRGAFMVIIGLTMDYLPFMLMPIYLVLKNIDKAYLEASTDLGANKWTTFYKVVLPLSMSGIISGFLMVFTPAVSTYYLSAYLGDNTTFMLGEELNLMFTKNHDYSGGAVIAIVLLSFVLISFFITNWLSKLGNKRGGII